MIPHGFFRHRFTAHQIIQLLNCEIINIFCLFSCDLQEDNLENRQGGGGHVKIRCGFCI